MQMAGSRDGYMCGWCKERNTISGLLEHCNENHPRECIKYRRRQLCDTTGRILWQSFVVPIIPEEVHSSGKHIKYDDDLDQFTI